MQLKINSNPDLMDIVKQSLYEQKLFRYWIWMDDWVHEAVYIST